MESHEFDIDIRPDGKVQVHIHGVKGKSCLEYARLFEKILGGGTAAVEQTSEFYEPPTDVQIHIEEKAGP
jgi:hypothetical protein